MFSALCKVALEAFSSFSLFSRNIRSCSASPPRKRAGASEGQDEIVWKKTRARELQCVTPPHMPSHPPLPPPNIWGRFRQTLPSALSLSLCLNHSYPFFTSPAASPCYLSTHLSRRWPPRPLPCVHHCCNGGFDVADFLVRLSCLDCVLIPAAKAACVSRSYFFPNLFCGETVHTFIFRRRPIPTSTILATSRFVSAT